MNKVVGILPVLWLTNLFLIFFYAPVERTMGIVQKVFYFHLAAAWIGFVAFFVVFVACVHYLRTRRPDYDWIASSSAEVGTLFTTIVLITGPLWARPVWNTWWTWDPRLTSTLVMWFMYVAYIILQRSAMSDHVRPRVAAVYGIISFANVPLVFFSIRYWRSLHPVVISTSGTGLSPQMLHTLLFGLVTFLALFLVLVIIRVRMQRLQQRVWLLHKQTLRKRGEV